MSRTAVLDLFAEDQAHEEVVGAIVRRVARDEGVSIELRVRRARGGHGRANSELRIYQRSLTEGIPGLNFPDLLVVAIDANCKRYAAARKEIEGVLQGGLRNLAAIACPDPHIERWCLVDPASFQKVVGVSPKMPRRKCQRDAYKKVLSESVKLGGHVPTLGGIEFAADLVEAMDLYRADKADRSLKAFIEELQGRFRNLGASASEGATT
ncbi:MAG: hypothetical protein ACE15C_14990 [Phycisphaerae bacterium]